MITDLVTSSEYPVYKPYEKLNVRDYTLNIQYERGDVNSKAGKESRQPSQQNSYTNWFKFRMNIENRISYRSQTLNETP